MGKAIDCQMHHNMAVSVASKHTSKFRRCKVGSRRIQNWRASQHFATSSARIIAIAISNDDLLFNVVLNLYTVSQHAGFSGEQLTSWVLWWCLWPQARRRATSDVCVCDLP